MKQEEAFSCKRSLEYMPCLEIISRNAIKKSSHLKFGICQALPRSPISSQNHYQISNLLGLILCKTWQNQVPWYHQYSSFHYDSPSSLQNPTLIAQPWARSSVHGGEAFEDAVLEVGQRRSSGCGRILQGLFPTS